MIYLVGAPNTGKSTLFGALCGRYARAGNREGVTVQAETVRARLIRAPGRPMVWLTDLPGIRVVPPKAPDETVSVRALAAAQAGSVAVFVADAGRLAAGLNLFLSLTAYLRSVRPDGGVGLRFVLAVNGCDKLRRAEETINQRDEKAIHRQARALPSSDMAVPSETDSLVDVRELSALLGMPAAGVSAVKHKGLAELSVLLADMDSARPIARLSAPAEPFAVEGGRGRKPYTVPSVPAGGWRHSPSLTGEEMAGRVLLGQVPPPSGRRMALDRLLTRGPVGVAVLCLVFAGLMTFVFGPPGLALDALLSRGQTLLMRGLDRLPTGTPAWVSSLLTEGIGGGVGAVLSFLPRLFLLWLGLGILEETGYLPRAARLADPFMRRLGLCGEALIPLLLGFGCTVPAVLTTRTVADGRVREKTLGLCCLVTCSARMPLFSLLSQAFFSSYRCGSLLFCGGMYLCSALVVLLTACLTRLLSRFRQRRPANPSADRSANPSADRSVNLHATGGAGARTAAPGQEEQTDTDERPLPDIKLPSPRAVLQACGRHLLDFLGRVGGVIFLTSLLAWLLLHTTLRLHWTDCPGADSLLLSLGGLLAPLLAPVGLDHPAVAASLLAGIGAKESIVAVLAVCLSGACLPGGSPSGGSGLSQALAASGWLTPRSALSLGLFAAFYIPCTAALGSLTCEWPGCKTCHMACHSATGRTAEQNRPRSRRCVCGHKDGPPLCREPWRYGRLAAALLRGLGVAYLAGMGSLSHAAISKATRGR